MEEQQGAGLKSLIRPFGKKNVALRNQWLLILDTEDPGVKGVLGNSRIDRLAGYLEERKRLPFGVEIAAVDCCQGAALFGEGFNIGALKLKLGAAQDPRNNHASIETKQLQNDGRRESGHDLDETKITEPARKKNAALWQIRTKMSCASASFPAN